MGLRLCVLACVVPRQYKPLGVVASPDAGQRVDCGLVGRDQSLLTANEWKLNDIFTNQ
jgi:hypothetical protein